MNPEYDPPQWSFYPSQESQSQWGHPLYSPSQPEPDWSRRPYSQSQNEQQWSGAQASVDSYFQNYQFVAPQRVEEEDDDEGEGEGEEENEFEEENDDREEENEEEEVQNIHVQPRPVAEGSSRTGVGKYVSKVMKRFSSRKNKGIEPSKYTPSSYK